MDKTNGFTREEVPKDIFDKEKGQHTLMYAASLDKGEISDGWDDMGTCAVALLNSCAGDLAVAIKVIKAAHEVTHG